MLIKVVCLAFSLNAFCRENSPIIDLKKTKSYIDEKLAAAVVDSDPFPHIIVRDILPPELYQDLEFFWPEDEAFDASNNRYRKHLYVTRGCAEIRKEPLTDVSGIEDFSSEKPHEDISDSLPESPERDASFVEAPSRAVPGGFLTHQPLTEDQCRFWRTFGEVVVKYIKNRVIELLMPYICVKFPHADRHLLDYIRNHISFFDHRQDGLMIDYANYHIGPHVDQAYLLAGMLLYCPKDMDHLDYGTAFYNSDDKRLLAYDTGAIPNYYTKDEFF
jgi:hypothetical protein